VRRYCYTLLALLSVGGLGRALATGHCCKDYCTVAPPSSCPDCPCPCQHRHALLVFGPKDAHKYLDKLLGCDTTCCERIKAVKKLGCRLHADFCKDPDVLVALTDVLLFDPCWEVRRTAAWSIFGQRAYTHEALLALYVSRNLDPHYMVRQRATEAQELLTLCRSACYKSLYAYGDALVKELRKQGYKAGEKNAREAFVTAVELASTEPAPSGAAQPTSPEFSPTRPPTIPGLREGERLGSPQGPGTGPAGPLGPGFSPTRPPTIPGLREGQRSSSESLPPAGQPVAAPGQLPARMPTTP
jgi:hypothetical protein